MTVSPLFARREDRYGLFMQISEESVLPALALSVRSRCECQATLIAEVNAQFQVLSGKAKRGKDEELAPAHSIGADAERFDVAWACPFCGRNTLRSFNASVLTRGRAA